MTTSQRVEAILKLAPQTRNSDKELWIIYAQKSNVNLTSQQIEAIRDMPEFETLRRVRQKIQSEGNYEADPQIKKERLHKSMIIQQNAPTAKTEHLENLITRRPVPWN